MPESPVVSTPPAETICVECAHCKLGQLGMFCALSSKRNQVTGIWRGTACATRRDDGKPCPDWVAAPPPTECEEKTE